MESVSKGHLGTFPHAEPSVGNIAINQVLVDH